MFRCPGGDAAAQVVLLPELEGVAHIVGPGLLLQPEGDEVGIGGLPNPMNLSPMRYRSYTWPHNPRVYSIDYHRTLAVHKLPFGLYRGRPPGEACRPLQPCQLVQQGGGEGVHLLPAPSAGGSFRPLLLRSGGGRAAGLRDKLKEGEGLD